MDLQGDIEELRRRFHSGDASARVALAGLLYRYVSILLRRAARQPSSESPLIRGIRRLAGKTSGYGYEDDSNLPTANELSRLLCDELLLSPSGSRVEPSARETIQLMARVTVESQQRDRR